MNSFNDFLRKSERSLSSTFNRNQRNNNDSTGLLNAPFFIVDVVFYFFNFFFKADLEEVGSLCKSLSYKQVELYSFFYI